MGRGRAKAKQTKVARELKYSSPTTDLESLQRELSGGSSKSHRGGITSGGISSSDAESYTRVEEDEYEDWRR
ncbi:MULTISPECIES: DUF3073 domain-containing protein [unclassified Rhodococcus (in: high G+C Gram-positive bacteria)]|uniref:DUF3073 domain-containing protein n=1 Tax=unclassified Rhodococcus (in: high G+C Gram-positive bacteria) TaxID=192944 RepID=UPI000A00E726|nr:MULTISPECIES: DUF3073 domain-containing protein [unclassified Rhodococcus (in: high G+C Gram-positive bacteria)]QCB50132.1 DUF3073 domain-containing protein [Rhodococcus sp. PAMC28705]QCB58175.1 DUF3073 domain-containing protein [Rhodococcus sp. PAMC28707]